MILQTIKQMKLKYKLILLCMLIGFLGSVYLFKETVAHPDSLESPCQSQLTPPNKGH